MYPVPQQTPPSPTYDAMPTVTPPAMPPAMSPAMPPAMSPAMPPAMPPVQPPMQAPVQAPKAPSNADLENGPEIEFPNLVGSYSRLILRDDLNLPQNIKDIEG